MASLDFETEKNNFRKFYDDYKDEHRQRVLIMEQLLGAILGEKFEGQIAISSRLKDREECIQKFSRKYQKNLENEEKDYEIKNYITDLYGLRVVCSYEDEIEKIVNILENEFEVIEKTDKVKQIESESNLFGYKGIHLDVQLKPERLDMIEYKKCDQNRFEIQIRTITQDAWSTIDHSINYKKDIPLYLKRRVMTLAALFELADHEFLSIRDKTAAYIEEAKKAVSSKDNENEEINALNFQVFLDDAFKDSNFTFNSKKVDGFVSEIKGMSENKLTLGICKQMIDDFRKDISEYKKYLQDEKKVSDLNPFTEFRHMLFLYNNELYKDILFDLQRKNFEEWMKLKHSDSIEHSDGIVS